MAAQVPPRLRLREDCCTPTDWKDSLGDECELAASSWSFDHRLA